MRTLQGMLRLRGRLFMDEPLICEACKGAEVSWRDCDIHTEQECYATECDTPLGCGFISRDCEDLEFIHD